MSSLLLATQSPNKNKQLAVTLGVGGVAVGAAALHLYWRKKKLLLKHGGEKKSPPMVPMGILETVRLVADPRIPFIFLELAKKLDSWIFELNLPIPGHPKTLVVAELEDLRTILQDKLTEKPYALYGQMAEMSPTREPSMFVMQASSAEWHRRRKGTMPAFASKHVRWMNEVAVKHTEEWINTRLVKFVENGEAFDVVEEMLKLILKAFCETALEYDISMEEIDMFLYEWDLIAKEYLLKSTSNPLRKYFTLFLSERKRAKQATYKVDDLFQKIIDNYRTLESPREGTVIKLIMENPTFKTDGEIKSEVFMYFVAGHDTTAVSLSWILMELGKHPEVQTQLRKALSDVDPADWSKCTVLKTTVQEGLRMHPVSAAALTRCTGRDIISSKGYFIPKGSFVFLPTFLIGRNPDIYENADAFIPSRWNQPTKDMKKAFVPFALGAQNCAGQSLANAELHSILAKLIQGCEFTLENEGTAEFQLVLKPVGLRMKARRVSE